MRFVSGRKKRLVCPPILCLMVSCSLFARPFVALGADSDRQDLRVTVYNNDLGLVSERRILDISAGDGRVELADVPAQIDPTSVYIRPASPGVRFLEQNFQFDLASSERVTQRYIGQAVDVVLRDGGLKNGTLLSCDAGSLVIQDRDGGISLVARDQVADFRLPKLPDGLRAKPALVWLVQSEHGGRMPVELTYLTSGMNWHAEYVAIDNDKDSALDLSAWVSLENESGASYPNATLQLIAGEIQRVRPAPMIMARKEGLSGNNPAEGFAEESFFEYHLYTLDRRTTIADRETKQVTLFPETNAPVTKMYEYDGQTDAKGVRVILEAENREDLGLGMPLPAGKVRVYKKDQRGGLQFIGEDHIDHTPKNEKIRVSVGKAFDVIGERTELSMNRVSDRIVERTVEVRLRNHKEDTISVVVHESIYGDWEITKSTFPFVKKDATTAEFRLAVPSNQETILTFTVRQL